MKCFENLKVNDNFVDLETNQEKFTMLLYLNLKQFTSNLMEKLVKKTFINIFSLTPKLKLMIIITKIYFKKIINFLNPLNFLTAFVF